MNKHVMMCACVLSLASMSPAFAQPGPDTKRKAGKALVFKGIDLPVQQLVDTVAIDNVLEAKGKNVVGKNGVSLTLHNIEKVGDNGYRIEFTVEGNLANAAGRPRDPNQNQGGPRPAVRWVGGARNQNMPHLIDAQGKSYQIVQVPSSRMSFNNGIVKRTYVVEYRADADQGLPVQLLLTEPGQPVQPPLRPVPMPPVQPFPKGNV